MQIRYDLVFSYDRLCELNDLRISHSAPKRIDWNFSKNINQSNSNVAINAAQHKQKSVFSIHIFNNKQFLIKSTRLFSKLLQYITC